MFKKSSIQGLLKIRQIPINFKQIKILFTLILYVLKLQLSVPIKKGMTIHAQETG